MRRANSIHGMVLDRNPNEGRHGGIVGKRRPRAAFRAIPEGVDFHVKGVQRDTSASLGRQSRNHVSAAASRRAGRLRTPSAPARRLRPGTAGALSKHVPSPSLDEFPHRRRDDLGAAAVPQVVVGEEPVDPRHKVRVEGKGAVTAGRHQPATKRQRLKYGG